MNAFYEFFRTKAFQILPNGKGLFFLDLDQNRCLKPMNAKMGDGKSLIPKASTRFRDKKDW